MISRCFGSGSFYVQRKGMNVLYMILGLLVVVGITLYFLIVTNLERWVAAFTACLTPKVEPAEPKLGRVVMRKSGDPIAPVAASNTVMAPFYTGCALTLAADEAVAATAKALESLAEDI